MSDSDELTDQLSELRVSSAQPLDIQSSEKWKNVKLCHYNRLTKDGKEVAGFDQSTGEPTLWFEDEQQIGRKILNYQSCIPLLNEGFAKKYAEYEGMFLRESPLGDENFQAFLFVKWLDSKNENLHIFFNMCLSDDRANLYKAWLIEVCGFSNKKKTLTALGNELQQYKKNETKKLAKRKYTKKPKEQLALDDHKGSDLVALFSKIVSKCTENYKIKIQFTIRGEPVFALNCKDEFGNGVLVFSPEVEKVYPRWEPLSKTILKLGFARQYKVLMQRKFGELFDRIELKKSFQAFVLLQFEVTRVSHNDQAQLTTQEVRKGIQCALFLDDKKYYSHMTKMFTGDKRKIYYGLLKERVDFEKNFLEKMKQ